MSDNLKIQFRFLGIGFDTSKSKAAAWQYRGSPDHGLAALTNPPKSLTRGFDPMSGDLSFASFSPTLKYGDLDPSASKQASTTFLHRDVNGIGTLDSDIGSSATDIPLDESGHDDEVVYIGNEAIKLGTHDSNSYTDSTRDYWELESLNANVSHSAGDTVYQDPPFWQGRLVEMHVLWPGQSDNAQWLGIVHNVTTGPKGTTLRVACDSYWSTILSVEMGQDTDPIPPSTHDIGVNRTNSEPGVEVRSGIPNGYFRKGYTTQVMAESDWDLLTENVALQVEDALILQPGNVGFNTGFLGAGELPDPPPEGVALAGYEESVREVVVYGKAIEDVLLNDGRATDVSTTPIPTRSLNSEGIVHHPVAIARTHLDNATPAFGFVKETWGLGLPVWEKTNVAQLGHLEDTSFMEVDHLVFGWDGDTVNGKYFLDMCRRWGWILGINADGTAKFRRWGMPTIEDKSSANDLDPNIDDFSWDAGYNREVTDVTAKVGELPFRKGQLVDVDVVDRPQPDWVKGRPVDFEYDGVLRENRQTVEQLVVAEIEKLKHGYMKLTVRADHPQKISGVSSWDMGKWVSLQSLPPKKAWPVDNAGARTKPDGGEQWLAQIIGTTQNLRNGTYRLDLVVPRTGVAKWRSASMEVDTINSTADRAYVTSNSVFGSRNPDNEAFDVGDDIQVHDLDLSVSSDATVYEIQQIGNDANGDFIEVDPDWASDPTGKIIRLANIDDYANAGAALSGIDRPWMYLADSSHTLGSSDDEGDVYGR